MSIEYEFLTMRRRLLAFAPVALGVVATAVGFSSADSTWTRDVSFTGLLFALLLYAALTWGRLRIDEQGFSIARTYGHRYIPFADVLWVERSPVSLRVHVAPGEVIAIARHPYMEGVEHRIERFSVASAGASLEEAWRRWQARRCSLGGD